MSFEIRTKDLLGRIGLLHTNHGVVETPLLLPVVNPNSQLITPRELKSNFGFNALITNSYLVWKQFREEKDVPKIHRLLDFDGVIMTDSGAYQILQYGDVEVQPAEIIGFQEKLDSDIAVILDVPTGQEVSKERAKWTVNETLRRADEALRLVTRRDILWVGPIQGGTFCDLITYSARETGKRDFAIHALGSPTPVMQQYRFDLLVDMIMAAKLNLPTDRPLHLFGAGHPMMFALAVALGCDIFDSASYALFARNGRYMTAQGTAKFEDLVYFPCSCPTCHGRSPEELRKLLPTDRERFLASHNLNSCLNELQTIKQAIVDGRLWELVESRSRNHPALQRAFNRMLYYVKNLERETPIRKRKGPFVTTVESLNRPEIQRYQERLLDRYEPPPRAKRVLLLPEEYLKPFQDIPTQVSLLQKIEKRSDVHICSYGLTFAVVPYELLDVYPLSQTEDSLSPNSTTVGLASRRITNYLKAAHYGSCVMVVREPWHMKLASSLRAKLRGRMNIKLLESKQVDDELVSRILRTLKARGRR